MTATSSKHVSPWVDTMHSPALGDTSFRDARADVVVIGAGIVGVTTALASTRS